jgi:hypothetical protein
MTDFNFYPRNSFAVKTFSFSASCNFLSKIFCLFSCFALNFCAGLLFERQFKLFEHRQKIDIV